MTLKSTSASSFTDAPSVSGTKYTYSVKCIASSISVSCKKFITYIAAPVISTLKNYSSYVYVKWGKVDWAALYRVTVKQPGKQSGQN